MKCRFRKEYGGCSLGVCPNDEICNIEEAEPNCSDYEPCVDIGEKE